MGRRPQRRPDQPPVRRRLRSGRPRGPQDVARRPRRSRCRAHRARGLHACHPARRRVEGPRPGRPLRREHQHSRGSRQQVPALIAPEPACVRSPQPESAQTSAAAPGPYGSGPPASRSRPSAEPRPDREQRRRRFSKSCPEAVASMKSSMRKSCWRAYDSPNHLSSSARSPRSLRMRLSPAEPAVQVSRYRRQSLSGCQSFRRFGSARRPRADRSAGTR